MSHHYAPDQKKADHFSNVLLGWYDDHHRALPWRVTPPDYQAGIRADPYKVWLSEIMCQQTTIAAVIPYFYRFVDRWPNIHALAAASLDDIKSEWAGLGYYRRADYLKRCADFVVEHYDGVFPNIAKALKDLPGIGDYTSAAIAAICSHEPVAVVDGNVERVFARLMRLDTPLPKAKKQIKDSVTCYVPALRPGDFAQALMDLGATICTARNPACSLCPLTSFCQAFQKGDPTDFPKKMRKKAKPIRHGIAYVVRRGDDDALLLHKRPQKALLGGMSFVPTSNWSAKNDDVDMPPPMPCNRWHDHGVVKHVFTHFTLMMHVRFGIIEDDYAPPPAFYWCKRDAMSREALPGLMQKILAQSHEASSRSV